MNIKQFYDKGLAHGSYAIESGGEVALVDPARDPGPYLEFAKEHQARIVAVLETHPHADFASSHLEFYQKYGAVIYTNPEVGAAYPHQPVKDGDEIEIGEVRFKTLFTPGHSPDHNSYLLLDKNGLPHSVYTGDSLFVGDVGRPDLREGVGKVQVQREGLARMMYHTLNNVFNNLPDEVVVYPAHGAGSLCGKSMSSDTFSTIGREKAENWAFQLKNETEFVKALLEDQPFIPKYFPFDVDINRKGVPSLNENISAVPRLDPQAPLDPRTVVVDTRPQDQFKAGHINGAINIQDGPKFETWLGSIIGPDERFYLISENQDTLDQVLEKSAKIGYESLILGALSNPDGGQARSQIIPLEDFKANPQDYTIVDVRNPNESLEAPIFQDAQNIPLPQLRERVKEIPTNKPIVVHCAGGYRSAAGASIVESGLDHKVRVYDLSEAVKDFE